MPRMPGKRFKSFIERERERNEIIKDFEIMLDKCYFWQIFKKKEIKQKLRFLYDDMETIREEAESERIERKAW